MRLISLLLLLWLAIGAFAAYQRDYFNGKVSCAKAGNTALTVLAGPLNYVGVHPAVDCSGVDVPQPST